MIDMLTIGHILTLISAISPVNVVSGEVVAFNEGSIFYPKYECFNEIIFENNSNIIINPCEPIFRYLDIYNNYTFFMLGDKLIRIETLFGEYIWKCDK